jgi:hypothetical protein
MQIDGRNKQPRNAASSIDESLEPDSNVRLERDSHSQKHRSPSFSTDEGMQMDKNDEQAENTPSSRDGSLEPDSNATVERDEHLSKLWVALPRIEEGMQIRWILGLP